MCAAAAHGRRVDAALDDAAAGDVVDHASAIEGQLVDAGAVDDERPLGAEDARHLGDAWRSGGVGDPDDGPRGARGVRERADQVERGADADLAPGRAGVAHRGVEDRREQEREAELVQLPGRRFGVVVDPDAQGVEDVRRARAR